MKSLVFYKVRWLKLKPISLLLTRIQGIYVCCCFYGNVYMLK